jgi:hypothetical protein
MHAESNEIASDRFDMEKAGDGNEIGNADVPHVIRTLTTISTRLSVIN